jgi:hypothetical protein
VGFQKPDLREAARAISASLREIASPYNDGWTSAACKKELYQLKCWLEDEYAKLPEFFEEKQWEQERIIQTLKQPEKR